MLEAKAQLSRYRQSPRKVRLLADLVRGRRVSEALAILSHTPKKATGVLTKLINSAVANARISGAEEAEHLGITEIRVDEGPTLRRFMPAWRGTARRINKRTSHIRLTLGTTKKKDGRDIRKGEA